MATASGDADTLHMVGTEAINILEAVLLPNCKEKHTLHILENGHLQSIVHSASSADDTTPFSSSSLLVLPSLCHPHIHLDKPYLLTHPTTQHLCPEVGTFSEALSMTAAAKPLFNAVDLRNRMDMLLASSSTAGVTHCRAFVEVDATVGLLSLQAALATKERWEGMMRLQVCAFAQDPVFSGPDADKNRSLVERAVQLDKVEVLGSTPYVESNASKLRQNVEWAVRTAIDAGKHLDLHLDYNIDVNTEPSIWFVLDTLRRERWLDRAPNKTVCLGHCTRLTCFGPDEWRRLRREVEGLPVYFVGLPTSDVFMMGRPAAKSEDEEEQLYAACCDRPRATLQVGAMMAAGFNVCLGINNIQNAFTPYGSTDPLSLAQWGVGIYQAGTPEAAANLFDCVSRRAKLAIGLLENADDSANTQSLLKRKPGEVKAGDKADFLLIGQPEGDEKFPHRRHRRVCEVVWDAGAYRKTVYNGLWVRAE